MNATSLTVNDMLRSSCWEQKRTRSSRSIEIELSGTAARKSEQTRWTEANADRPSLLDIIFDGRTNHVKSSSIASLTFSTLVESKFGVPKALISTPKTESQPAVRDSP